MGQFSLLEKLAQKFALGARHRRRGTSVQRRRENEMTPQPPRSRVQTMFWFMLPLIAAVSALIPSSEFSGNADLWRQQSIYEVLATTRKH
jgi:hypothetical protein